MTFLKRYHAEQIGPWWRRLHREGKKFMEKGKVDLVKSVKGTNFNFAGHLARLQPEDTLKKVLTARNIAQWRFLQAQATSRTHARTAGGSSHPRRFNALRRWESPFEKHFGVYESQSPEFLVGWMQVAQDRDEWKKRRVSFVS